MTVDTTRRTAATQAGGEGLPGPGPSPLSDRFGGDDLRPRPANHVPLSPVGLLARNAAIRPRAIALVQGRRRQDWALTDQRCRRLAGALTRRGIGPGDSVAVLAANTIELFELHFAVPMTGGVLAALNTRLDGADLAHILGHCGARMLIVDRAFSGLAADALGRLDSRPVVIDIDDPASHERGPPLGALDYEALLLEGDVTDTPAPIGDEWDAISLNYTSGTTGRPKGVVYHHRGAYLNALSNALVWRLTEACVYLWTLPMFHCNGWCFPWTLAAVGGTSVCLRQVRTHAIIEAIAREGVTHLCGTPTVLTMIDDAGAERIRSLNAEISVMVAAAPPAAAVIEAIERHGWSVTHAYGLTESYGPALVNEWQPAWNTLDAPRQQALKVRQGVRGPTLDAAMVGDPVSLRAVPADGQTVGELLLRGNTVMKGYLGDPAATEAALRGGWLHTGDLAVQHPDGYIEIRDRARDVVISGGETIATIEIEDVLHQHKSVRAAAVVGRPDPVRGETPCAYVERVEGAHVTAGELIAFCRARLAQARAPRHVVFRELPRTSTGKVQKFMLRDHAQAQAARARDPTEPDPVSADDTDRSAEGDQAR